MVDTVKTDKEVSLEYMKFHELEERLLNQGRKEGHEEGFKEGQAEGFKEGQAIERANTERERQRADAAYLELAALREELKLYKEKNNSI